MRNCTPSDGDRSATRQGSGLNICNLYIAACGKTEMKHLTEHLKLSLEGAWGMDIKEQSD